MFNPGDGHDDTIPKTEEKKSFEEQYIGIIIGALAFLIVVLFAIVMFIVIRHNKQKQNNNRLGMKPIVDHVTLNMSNMPTLHPAVTAKISKGNMYTGVATEDMDTHVCNGGDKILKGYSDPKDSIQGRNLPDLPSSSEGQGIVAMVTCQMLCACLFCYIVPRTIFPCRYWLRMLKYSHPVALSALLYLRFITYPCLFSSS